jgi:1-deoxy-D-xylulose-5-phosphate reductoisomerase
VVIGDETKYGLVKEALADLPIHVLAGSKSLEEVVVLEEVDVVLTALVGYAGLLPTVKAIRAKKTIALANKETLVVAGALIMPLAKEMGVSILPVDSEHSAIFQCLMGESHNPIEKIILTASGGPFRGFSREQLSTVTRAQALKHPNWTMGAKITIDSASLMNKGLEVIEAKWLFNLTSDQIDVIVHPQSIIHSIVQFTDGSMKAQMGLPDMKLPIQYAFTYPERILSKFPRFDFFNYPQLTFEKPDTETFTNLALAFKAMEKGGNMPCVLNAANEMVVQAFLEDKIGFLQMSDLIAQALDKMPMIQTPSLEDYIQCDKETRLLTTELIKK